MLTRNIGWRAQSMAMWLGGAWQLVQPNGTRMSLGIWIGSWQRLKQVWRVAALEVELDRFGLGQLGMTRVDCG
jgi:hypothetical protein